MYMLLERISSDRLWVSKSRAAPAIDKVPTPTLRINQHTPHRIAHSVQLEMQKLPRNAWSLDLFKSRLTDNTLFVALDNFGKYHSLYCQRLEGKWILYRILNAEEFVRVIRKEYHRAKPDKTRVVYNVTSLTKLHHGFGYQHSFYTTSKYNLTRLLETATLTMDESIKEQNFNRLFFHPNGKISFVAKNQITRQWLDVTWLEMK